MRSLLLLLLPVLVAADLPPGTGFHDVDPETLREYGYPDDQHGFYDGTWGILYDEDGVAFGPGAFYEETNRVMHPHFSVDEEKLESRWVVLHRSGCCSEALHGRFLELLDLAYFDMTDALGFHPDKKFQAYGTTDFAEYQRIAKGWYSPWRADGTTLVFLDVPNLFKSTIIGHVTRNAIVDGLLDLKCHGRLEPWFQFGVGSYLAQEGFEHLSYVLQYRGQRDVLLSPEQLMRWIHPQEEFGDARLARYNAYLVVWHLAENHGWDRVLRITDLVEAGRSFQDAIQEEYGLSMEEFWERFDPRVLGEPTTTAIRTNQ